MTVAFNIRKETNRTIFKLMRYVTDTIAELFSYIAALLLLCYFSCINFSHPVSL